MSISERDLRNSFELHLRDVLTKFDAELSVDDDGKIEVTIHADPTIGRPALVYSKGGFYGFSEEELNQR